ncbi:hypothetical protein [Xenorhabdus sp. SGI240]|uniref:hypothetical protein n=1 Tax=Xenorhabdus sp. SGI240 TaxID=3158262 RepID=UPI0032B754D8
MSDLCLSLMTKRNVVPGSDPLAQIWSLEHWISTLNRVCHINRISESATRQHFILHFDAGRPDPDRVEVERVRSDDRICVTHIIPPPNVLALSAEWWIEHTHPNVIFAKRCLLIEENVYSPNVARKMFVLLSENVDRLTGQTLCRPK